MFSVMWEGKKKSYQSRKEEKRGEWKTCDMKVERTVVEEGSGPERYGKALREGNI